MDTFMHFRMFSMYSEPKCRHKIMCKIRKVLSIDETLHFSNNAAVRELRTYLKYQITEKNRHTPLKYYIHLGRFSLSDCGWDRVMFNEMQFICRHIDKLLIEHKLIRFTEFGIVFDNTYTCNPKNHLQELIKYQIITEEDQF